MITSWLSTKKNMLSMAWHDKAYHCVAMTFNYHDLEKYLCILNSRKKDKLETRLLCIMPNISYKNVFKFVLKPEKVE